MNKLLKYPWSDKDKHFFTSDWHIYHDPNWPIPIWKSRGYNSSKESAQIIQNTINDKVGKEDILWVMGDLFLNSSDEQCLEWLSGLKCDNIYKLWGNHCSNTFRLYRQEIMNQFGRDDIEVYPITMGKVTFLGNHQEIQIGKKRIIMNHFPIHNWNHIGRASYNLHGHSHNNDHTRNPDFPLGKCLDCSWDWKKNVWSFDEIEEVMETKTVKLYDHHDSAT
jgi:calcineurin-like phosphoesterase family protein